MSKLSKAQERALDKFQLGQAKSAYEAKESLATLTALIKKGRLVDVTPRGPGAMFSPQTHYKFMRTA